MPVEQGIAHEGELRIASYELLYFDCAWHVDIPSYDCEVGSESFDFSQGDVLGRAGPSDP